MSIFAVDKDGNRKQIAGVGLPGPAGKSAYQYAVEGGFAGTEAEFSSMQARAFEIRSITHAEIDAIMDGGAAL